MDTLSKLERSERMAKIRNKNTKPEMVVRKLVHGMGYRYRLYAKDLPGKPDLVFRKKQKVIFVHGCFWHQHGCNQYRMPKTKQDFWLPKLEKNVNTDQRNRQALLDQGWEVLVIWECELKDLADVQSKIKRFLDE